jgi:hypothetical protein
LGIEADSFVANSIIAATGGKDPTNARIEMTNHADATETLTVHTTLRPWRVCADCGHAWKSRATHGRPRCRACEVRLRNDAETASAALAGGLRR